MQILGAGLVTLLLATLGFLSPAARGALLTGGMLCFVLLAATGGFAAVYVWALMERSWNNWQGVAARVALYYPGLNLALFTLLNLAITRTGSTGAVPLGVYVTLVAAWFLVATPLTFFGGMLAVRGEEDGGEASGRGGESGRGGKGGRGARVVKGRAVWRAAADRRAAWLMRR